MPTEDLFVVNVLPENDPKAQEAIQSLKHIAMNMQVTKMITAEAATLFFRASASFL